MLNKTRVLLPEWVINAANQQMELEQYMKRYPDYTVIRVEGNCAICERVS